MVASVVLIIIASWLMRVLDTDIRSLYRRHVL